MCGRYVSPDEASIEREFDIVRTEWQFPPSYNVAPTQSVPVVRINKAGERMIARDIFGFAGLWDTSVGADGITVESCAIVTMPANQLMTEIHNVKHRMPAILAKEDRDAWLTGTTDEAFRVIKQYPDIHLVATPDSKRVNTPKNNDAELITPLQAA